jgi:flavin-binding protein dodecin
MTPGQVAEIQGRSNTSIEDAIKRGIATMDKTLQDVRCLWMRDRRERVVGGAIREYQVDMVITFVGDDWQPAV